MRMLKVSLVALAVTLLPAAAHAGFVLESSLGYGHLVKPEVKSEGQSILVAPGYSLMGIVRAELGFVFHRNVLNEEEADFGFQLRPMLVIDPPLVPIFVKGVAAIVDPFDSKTRHMAYGGFLGVGGSLFGFGLFGEAGVVPHFVDDETFWVVEGRAGFYYEFG